MNQKLIFWDWNGTLLNDVETCIGVMNIMLEKRKMKILDRNKYLNIFTFPVKDYYTTLGFNFNKESFEDLSTEYISLYSELSKNAHLQEGSFEILEYFKENENKQIILSASEQLSLENQIIDRKIDRYFSSILGLNNIYAYSKLDNALQYLKINQFPPNNVLFIGDTYHDYEVATAIGCSCILVRNGHQNLNRFKFNGNIKIEDSLISLLNVKLKCISSCN